MRSLALATLALALLLGSACSMDTRGSVGDYEREEGATRSPPPDCEPMSCDELGAGCGSIDNGCGQLIDCGGCEVGVCGADEANQCGGGSACIPKSCEELGAQCGLVDDGCGGSIECAGCADQPGTTCSDDHQCVVATCGGEGKNACNTCGELPAQPGDECACEGTAMCTVYGIQCDDGGAVLLDDTSDKQSWVALEGVAELSVQEWDYDEYQVVATDTILGALDPEFTVVHPGGFDLNVCVTMEGLEVPIESYCGSDDGVSLVEDGVRRGCCVNLAADQTGETRFDLDFPFAPFTDYTARYTLKIRAMRSRADGASPDSCEPYQVRYHF